MKKILLLSAIILFISCSNDAKEKENNNNNNVQISSLQPAAATAGIADNSWRKMLKDESREIQKRLDALGDQLQKSGKKVATKAKVELDEELKELDAQQKRFDSSGTKAEIIKNWEEFRTKANQFIDSLDSKLSIK